MALRATKGNENLHRPITNRPPDAIRPHMHHQELSYLAAPIRLAPIAMSS
jgi:hypothetical protein